jgi:hypothetical protein
MKKIQLKRVCLVSPEGERMDFAQDFFPTLPDIAILGLFHELGKTVWIGDNLYKIQQEQGIVRHYRYEVYHVTQYTKSWYDLLLDAVRRI